MENLQAKMKIHFSKQKGTKNNLKSVPACVHQLLPFSIDHYLTFSLPAVRSCIIKIVSYMTMQTLLKVLTHTSVDM